MYKLCVVVIILLIVGIVCGQTSLAQVNLEVQKLTKEVEKERNVNESLEMKIDEMTSLDRIKQVSQEYGLAYNLIYYYFIMRWNIWLGRLIPKKLELIIYLL